MEEETEKAVEADKMSNDNDVKTDLTNKTPQLVQPTEEKIEEDIQQVLTQEPTESDLISTTVSNGAEQPTVLLADSEGVKVVQSGTGPNVMTDVMFDTINYSKDGMSISWPSRDGEAFLIERSEDGVFWEEIDDSYPANDEGEITEFSDEDIFQYRKILYRVSRAED